MFDYKGKQGLGVILGIVSIGLAYLDFFFSLFVGSLELMMIGFGFGIVIGIVGTVMAGLSLKEAREIGARKGASIAGLILSIMGITTNLAMGIAFGGSILLTDFMIDRYT